MTNEAIQREGLSVEEVILLLSTDERLTIGTVYGPAMAVTDEAEARRYFAALVDRAVRKGVSRSKAEETQRTSLAYYAGYYSPEVRERVERLFVCAHPVFGAIAEKSEPTPEQAFIAGARWAANAATKFEIVDAYGMPFHALVMGDQLAIEIAEGLAYRYLTRSDAERFRDFLTAMLPRLSDARPQPGEASQ